MAGLLAACVLVSQCRTWARLQSWSGSLQTSLAWSHWVGVGEACRPGGGTCQHRHTLDSDTSLSFTMSPSSSPSLSASNSGGIFCWRRCFRWWAGVSSGQGCGAGWELAGQTDPQLPLRNVPSKLQRFQQCFEVLCPCRLLDLHY